MLQPMEAWQIFSIELVSEVYIRDDASAVILTILDGTLWEPGKRSTLKRSLCKVSLKSRGNPVFLLFKPKLLSSCSAFFLVKGSERMTSAFDLAIQYKPWIREGRPYK